MIRQVQPFPSWKSEFVPPVSEQQAQQRIDALLDRASELMECSTADTFQWETSGAELSLEEATTWLGQARYRVARYLEEVRELRRWTLKQRLLFKSELPKESDIRQALRECVVFMGHQFRKGQPFPDEGMAAFERAQALLEMKPLEVLQVSALLQRVRASKNGRFEDEMRYEGWRAMVTDEAARVDVLADTWMTVFRQSESGRVVACSSAEPLLEALAYFRRFEKANEIIDLVAPFTHPAAMLMYVAVNSNTEDDYRRVRQSLETITDPSRRVWLLLQFFQMTKDMAYWQRALETARSEGCFKKPSRERVFYASLIRAALMIGEVERVRELLPRLPPSRAVYVRSLALIYAHTGQEADKLRLLAEVDELIPTEQVIPMYEFVRALIAHGQYEDVQRFLARLEVPVSRCVVYAALSIVDGKTDTAMLDACEREYFSADVKSLGFKDLLGIFIRTQARAGRVSIATNAAGFIPASDGYCLALLFLYAASMGKTLPPTMLQRWSLHFS